MQLYNLPGQSSILTVMLRAVQAASKGIIRDFDELEHLQVSNRGTENFVHIAQRKVADQIKAQLLKARPAYSLLSEGDPAHTGSDPAFKWIVSPISGSLNFAHGMPHFAISVALQRQDEFVAGVVYDVFHQRCYMAEKGFGSYVNGRRIRVSGRKSMDQFVVVTDSAAIQTKRIAMLPCSIRNLGSTALDLAYVASGKCDALFVQESHICQIAAGYVLIKEAGGYISALHGNLYDLRAGEVLASSADMHPNLLIKLKA